MNYPKPAQQLVTKKGLVHSGSRFNDFRVTIGKGIQYDLTIESTEAWFRKIKCEKKNFFEHFLFVKGSGISFANLNEPRFEDINYSYTTVVSTKLHSYIYLLLSYKPCIWNQR